jgi:hypothetical protein
VSLALVLVGTWGAPSMLIAVLGSRKQNMCLQVENDGVANKSTKNNWQNETSSIILTLRHYIPYLVRLGITNIWLFTSMASSLIANYFLSIDFLLVGFRVKSEIKLNDFTTYPVIWLTSLSPSEWMNLNHTCKFLGPLYFANRTHVRALLLVSQRGPP